MGHRHRQARGASDVVPLMLDELVALRRQTVEHPFASIKHLILGNARLLMRHTSGARAEFSLAVMAYNLKRAFNMKGAAWMHQALRG